MALSEDLRPELNRLIDQFTEKYDSHLNFVDNVKLIEDLLTSCYIPRFDFNPNPDWVVDWLWSSNTEGCLCFSLRRENEGDPDPETDALSHCWPKLSEMALKERWLEQVMEKALELEVTNGAG